MPPQDALKIIEDKPKGEAKKDEKLKGELETALKILSGEEEADINPTTSVLKDKMYQFTIFQDYGLLTETEYQNVTGVKPDKKSVFDANFHGPTENSKFYTLGLEGLPFDVLAAMRKVRISMTEGFTNRKHLLDPDTNLVRGQGKRVFDHLASCELPKRPNSWKSKPVSAAQLLETEQAQQLRRKQAEQDNVLPLHHCICGTLLNI